MKTLDYIYALISIDEDGKEGITTIELEGRAMPMVGFSDEGLEMFDLVSEDMKAMTKGKLQLVKYTTKEIVKEY